MRVNLREFFQQPPLLNASIGVAANLNFEILGTNAADGGSVPYLSSGCALTTGALANDSIVARPHLDTNQTAWQAVTINPAESPVVRFEFITGASVSNCRIELGVRATPTAFDDATDNDKFCFVFDSSGGPTFQLLTSNNNVDTNTPTGVTIAANTSYFVTLAVDPISLIVTCTIRAGQTESGAPVYVFSSALRETAQGVVYCGIKALGAAARTLRVQLVELSQFQNIS